MGKLVDVGYLGVGGRWLREILKIGLKMGYGCRSGIGRAIVGYGKGWVLWSVVEKGLYEAVELFWLEFEIMISSHNAVIVILPFGVLFDILVMGLTTFHLKVQVGMRSGNSCFK